jgi:hypothetical protein
LTDSGNTHEWHHRRLQRAGLENRSLIGHAEQELTQALDIVGRVFHVDNNKIEVGPRKAAGIVKRVIEGEKADGGLARLEKFDGLVKAIRRLSESASTR